MSWRRAQSCAHISSAVAGVRSSAAGACAGSAGAAAAGQAGHSPLCSRHSCLAVGLWAQDAGTWLPAASASRAAASFPGSCRCQAAFLRWAGQRGLLAINHPDLPCCPSDEDVCPGAVSEQGSSTGRGAAPPTLVGCPQPWLSSQRRVRVLGEVGVQSAQRQQWDVPGVLGSQATAASLPSHLENLIHANYAEKKPF